MLPKFEDYGILVDPNQRGAATASDTYTTGVFLRDVVKANESRRNFRVFGPDETASNRLHAIYEATSKQWMGEYFDSDDTLAPDGRVMEMLSEHQVEGWLEGYLLTGGHGILSSYEAFIHIIDSMFNQHAKWLKMCNEIPWRNKLSSLNILLASHVWRQDHNVSAESVTSKQLISLLHCRVSRTKILDFYNTWPRRSQKSSVFTSHPMPTACYRL